MCARPAWRSSFFLSHTLSTKVAHTNSNIVCEVKQWSFRFRSCVESSIRERERERERERVVGLLIHRSIRGFITHSFSNPSSIRRKPKTANFFVNLHSMTSSVILRRSSSVISRCFFAALASIEPLPCRFPLTSTVSPVTDPKPFTRSPDRWISMRRRFLVRRSLRSSAITLTMRRLAARTVMKD